MGRPGDEAKHSNNSWKHNQSKIGALQCSQTVQGLIEQQVHYEKTVPCMFIVEPSLYSVYVIVQFSNVDNYFAGLRNVIYLLFS